MGNTAKVEVDKVIGGQKAVSVAPEMRRVSIGVTVQVARITQERIWNDDCRPFTFIEPLPKFEVCQRRKWVPHRFQTSFPISGLG